MPRGKTKFDRCVKAVRKRGGAYDPRAVCGALRAEGRLNPAVEVRPSQRFKGRWEVAAPGYPIETRKSKRGAISWANGWAKALSSSRGGDWRVEVRENPARDTDFSVSDLTDAWMAGVKRGEDLYRTSGVSGSRIAKESAESAFKTWWDYEGGSRSPLPKSKARSEWMRGFRKGRRYNPAGAAAEAFKRFHGRDPHEFVTVTKQIHRHGNLWSLGTLRMLKIRTERGQTAKLSGFKGAYLAANEQAFEDLAQLGRAKAQLYIEGGDQSVDLKSFGIDPDRAHEVETLGKAIAIDYHTVKVHLGSEGGDAIYRHKFRTTREGDREVTLRVAKYPDVIYRVLDQQLEFSGGSYEIRAEGIDK